MFCILLLRCLVTIYSVLPLITGVFLPSLSGTFLVSSSPWTGPGVDGFRFFLELSMSSSTCLKSTSKMGFAITGDKIGSSRRSCSRSSGLNFLCKKLVASRLGKLFYTLFCTLSLLNYIFSMLSRTAGSCFPQGFSFLQLTHLHLPGMQARPFS